VTSIECLPQFLTSQRPVDLSVFERLTNYYTTMFAHACMYVSLMTLHF